ncbi:BTB domain-containing protein [Favolaschia claudopus]|uniref:BTB domain-containing protein n=1 Tax=Favolaschia claudopus TaxID=2862362 RepID=A0AAV9ZEJ8_9AGAR
MSTVPCKRPRTDTGSEEAEPRTSTPHATRSEKYYFDDGDLIICAGNTLFKVHKFLLSRDSSMFKDMFAVPETPIAVDGLTDETPLFVADSAEAFEALLWILYALPPELRPYQLCVPTAVDLDCILLVAEITNKYHFVSLETWSIKIIETIVPAVSFTEARMMSFLMRTMTLAERVSNEELSHDVMVAWVSALQSGVNPGPLLAILDRDGPSSLATRTYYAQLLRMKVVPGAESPNNLPYLSECEGLSEPQVTKLLFGRWSLEAEFIRLSKITPPLPRGNHCAVMFHADFCIPEWKDIWRRCIGSNTVQECDSADLLQRMRLVHAYFSRNVNVGDAEISATCAQNICQFMSSLVEETRRSLGNHFRVPM